jgi:hypothetical protein
LLRRSGVADEVRIVGEAIGAEPPHNLAHLLRPKQA